MTTKEEYHTVDSLGVIQISRMLLLQGGTEIEVKHHFLEIIRQLTPFFVHGEVFLAVACV